MTTVNIQLPDDLAKKAEQKGLLSPEMVEDLFREGLRRNAHRELIAAMNEMAKLPDDSYMSPEEIAEEVRDMRAERRAAAHSNP